MDDSMSLTSAPEGGRQCGTGSRSVYAHRRVRARSENGRRKREPVFDGVFRRTISETQRRGECGRSAVNARSMPESKTIAPIDKQTDSSGSPLVVFQLLVRVNGCRERRIAKRRGKCGDGKILQWACRGVHKTRDRHLLFARFYAEGQRPDRINIYGRIFRL